MRGRGRPLPVGDTEALKSNSRCPWHRRRVKLGPRESTTRGSGHWGVTDRGEGYEKRISSRWTLSIENGRCPHQPKERTKLRENSINGRQCRQSIGRCHGTACRTSSSYRPRKMEPRSSKYRRRSKKQSSYPFSIDVKKKLTWSTNICNVVLWMK